MKFSVSYGVEGLRSQVTAYTVKHVVYQCVHMSHVSRAPHCAVHTHSSTCIVYKIVLSTIYDSPPHRSSPRRTRPRSTLASAQGEAMLGAPSRRRPRRPPRPSPCASCRPATCARRTGRAPRTRRRSRTRASPRPRSERSRSPAYRRRVRSPLAPVDFARRGSTRTSRAAHSSAPSSARSGRTNDFRRTVDSNRSK